MFLWIGIQYGHHRLPRTWLDIGVCGLEYNMAIPIGHILVGHRTIRKMF